MTERSRFTRWVMRLSPRRGLICHFYIEEKAKPFYGKVEFAYFNLFSSSRDWLVRGTKNHGISSARGRKSQVPCLNCFEVNEGFCGAIKEYETDRNGRFEIGVIFNKRKLKKDFEVINVSTNRPNPLPPPNKCHLFDNPRFRVNVLRPFHYCDIVRVEIPAEVDQFPAVSSIRWDAIMGVLVKPRNQNDIARLLHDKGLEQVEIFGVL
jgi:hypothetical protein